MIYDIVCVGGGPAGLTMCYCLGKLGYRCLLIDKNSSLGGCHRVDRVNNLFTEHGPRVYSSAYHNFMMLLNDMNLKFDDLFSPYKFSISNIGGKGLAHFTIRELLLFVREFGKLCFNKNHGKYTAVDTFIKANNFSKESSAYIDRLCRLTDGSGSDRYSLFQFLQLINQQGLYKLYQPSTPNDVGLIELWESKLENTDILYNTSAVELTSFNSSISSIKVRNDITGKVKTVQAQKFVLAIPPINLAQLLQKCTHRIQKSYGDIKQLDAWSKNTQYIHNIPIVFHWNRNLKLPDVHGFPNSDWNVAFIKLSDYMKFDEAESKTVISTCITTNDTLSKHSGKTANQSSRGELIREVLYQLRISFPGLPEPTAALISAGVVRSGKQWENLDTAYLTTPYTDPLKAKSEKYDNLYSVGTHNGNGLYHFTTLESAVTSALNAVHDIDPESINMYPIVAPWDLGNILKSIVIIGIIAGLIYYYD